MVRNASPLQSGHIAADNAMPYHQATHRTSRERSMRAANVCARARSNPGTEFPGRTRRLSRARGSSIAGPEEERTEGVAIVISANVEDRASSSGP